MKNVRAILMNQDTVLVVVVISIAPNMRPLIHQQDGFITNFCESLGDDTSSESRSYHEIIEHRFAPSLLLFCLSEDACDQLMRPCRPKSWIEGAHAKHC